MTSLDTSELAKIKLADVQYAPIQKIGLIGRFDSKNLGDAAIQKSAIDNIRILNPQAQIYGFSLQPQDTESRYGIPSYPIGKEANFNDYCWWRGEIKGSLSNKLTSFLIQWQKKAVDSQLRKLGSRFVFGTLESLAWSRAYRNFQYLELDVLIVSGGRQIDDGWGGTWEHPFTLLRWCLFAKMNGTKFYLVSIGTGKIHSALSKLFIRTTLSLSDYRSYRDIDSQRYIQKVVGFVSDDDPVNADLAFSLPIDSYQPLSKDYQERGVVGIAPIPYCHPQTWSKKNQLVYSQYLDKLTSFIVWLIEQQYAVALFPGQTDHDILAIEDLQKLLAAKKVSSLQIIQQPILTVDELMNQLANLDMAIASRYHSVLLSLLMNKPTLALSYSSQTNTLMADIGQADYCLSIDDFEVETMRNKFREIDTNYQQIAKQLASKTQEYKSSLIKQYEHLFLQS